MPQLKIKWIVTFDSCISCAWVLHIFKIHNNFFINPVQNDAWVKSDTSNWRIKKEIDEKVEFLISTTEIRKKKIIIIKQILSSIENIIRKYPLD